MKIICAVTIVLIAITCTSAQRLAIKSPTSGLSISVGGLDDDSVYGSRNMDAVWAAINGGRPNNLSTSNSDLGFASGSFDLDKYPGSNRTVPFTITTPGSDPLKFEVSGRIVITRLPSYGNYRSPVTRIEGPPTTPATTTTRPIKKFGRVHPFNGVWQTRNSAGQRFEMNMTADSSKVTGTYSPGNGTIVGTRFDNQLIFKWTLDGVKGSGKFTLSEDGKTFRGTFSTTGDPNDASGGQWVGWRPGDASIMPMKRFGRIAAYDGIWDTTTSAGNSYTLILNNAGDKVTGTYGTDGTINGTLFEGNVLLFKWSQDGGRSRGSGKFVLADDRKSFTGTWSNNTKDPNDASGGTWDGSKRESGN